MDPPTGGSASGCEESDYDGVAGKVALVQRGTCAFVVKWSLAQGAGATGVIVHNEGNTPSARARAFLPQVIAETDDGDPNHVVVVGAHLDSVPAGPGIDDDGSGTATLLAQAEEIAAVTTASATRSASPGGARRRTASSAPRTTRTT
ncbi:MAG TPA: PA domain-containing protein [Gaiellaceae bacterium]|nr:PA domain-containing protein [Gaiellaceae bacterium]